MNELPKTIPFDTAFKSALLAVAECGYCNLDADAYDSKEDFDADVANALSETLNTIGVPEPDGDRLDWMGHLYDLAEQVGICWRDEEGS